MNAKTGFAVALRELRKSGNLTQEDFSNVSSRTYLSSLERGMKSPTLEKVEALSCVMNIHPATLLMLTYCRGQDIKLRDLLMRVSDELKAAAIKA